MTGPAEKDLFLDLRPGGTAEEIARLFPPPVYFIAFVDGAAAPDKAALLAGLAAAFKFPASFGQNWDALLDCLRSLPEFNRAGGYVLALKNYGSLLAAAPGEMENFREIAAEAASFLGGSPGLSFKIVIY